MTGDDEAVLHALSTEPRSARAGETIRVLFRTRNVGTTPSPAGTVRFALGRGFEALDPLEVAVGAVAPGEDVVAAVRARVAPPAAERSEIVVRAALHLIDAVLATNACSVVVFGRPVFDGDGSGTYVEASSADAVRVRAAVMNQGDAPASGVRIVVPVPLGCARDDGRAEEVVEVPRLEVGERAETSFVARIVAVVGEVRAEGGVVHFGEGRRVALPARGGVAAEPLVAAPSVVVTAARRRADVAIGVRNDGWAEARDVRVRVELPAGLRWIAESFALEGAIVGGRGAAAAALARVERDGDARVVVISAVPARRNVHLTFGASYGPACADGTMTVRLGEHVTETRFVPVRVRDVRVHLIEAVRAASPGEALTLAARVENAGDVAERLSFGISGLPFAEQSFSSRMVAAGCATDVKLGVAVPHDVPDETPFTATLVATADDGESAGAEFALHIRRHIDSELEERYVQTALQRVAPCVRAELQVPDVAIAGAPFGVRLVIDVDDALDTLAVRAPAPGGIAHVQGSAALDGRVLLDGATPAAVSPFEGDGVVLRGVAERTRLVFAWSLRPDVDEIAESAITAQLDADGEVFVVTSPSVAIRARDSFAARPTGLRYHVETCATAPPCAAAAPPTATAAVPPTTTPAAARLPDDVIDERGDSLRIAPAIDEVRLMESVPSAFEPFMQLGAERLAEISRLFLTARFEGLVQHLFVLRFFFPDAVDADGDASDALEALRGALRDVFDRLFVKLRIPGFDVSSDDLEDPQLRRAAIAFFERRVFRAQDDGRDDGVRALLEAAPFGAPPVLRALVALLPARCDDDPAVGAALARYAASLDLALSRYEGLPLELFDDALARRGDTALDGARAELLGALRPHLEPVALAC